MTSLKQKRDRNETGLKPAKPPANGIIDGRKVYTVNAFCRELGIARKGSAYQRLLRLGLSVRLGRYIRGLDFLELLGRATDGDTIEETASTQDRSASEYPWDKWTDGAWWTAKKGSDFQTAAESFRRLLHTVAKRRRLSVATERDGEKVSFRFKKKTTRTKRF